jgi:hypothetical protein
VTYLQAPLEYDFNDRKGESDCCKTKAVRKEVRRSDAVVNPAYTENDWILNEKSMLTKITN